MCCCSVCHAVVFVSSPASRFLLDVFFFLLFFRPIPIFLLAAFLSFLLSLLFTSFSSPFLHPSPPSTLSIIFHLLFLLTVLLLSFCSYSSSSPWWFWADQLALLQYRLSLSSVGSPAPPPPGSGTLHTYQVLLPFSSTRPPPSLLSSLQFNLNHRKPPSSLPHPPTC